MKLVCWNINNFTDNKLNNPSQRDLILDTLRTYSSIAVVLEGPENNANPLATNLANSLGQSWLSASIETPARGREAESVLIVYDSLFVQNVANVRLAQIDGIGDFRQPVVFDATSDDNIDGNPGTLTVMAWHAPPGGDDTGPAWNQAKAWITSQNIHVICGDFNSNATAPRNFDDTTGALGATMLANPSLNRKSNIIWGPNTNDKIFVQKGINHHSATRINMCTVAKNAPERNTGGYKMRQSKERTTNEVLTTAHHVSDHVPLAITL